MVTGDRFLRGTITWMDHKADYSQPSKGKCKELYYHSPMYVSFHVVFKHHDNEKIHCIKTIIMAAL
jgi:hypothetical protein